MKRGADVGSDHLLAIANIRLKLRRTDQRHADHRRLDVNKLKDPDVNRSFTIQIRNRFQALSDQENNTQQEMEDTNHLWNQVKSTYQEAGRTILGHRNERHKDWISQEAWQKIEERKDIKKKVLSTKSERIKTQQQQAYREADRAVKQIIRHDKRKHLEDMATQAEEAVYKGDQRTLYKITKQVCGKFRSITTAPIKNKEGQLLTSETAQEARWTEHFNEVLNRPAPETEPDIQEAEEDLDVVTTPPTKEEIIRAIKSLRNNKAPGPDFLNAELFKFDPPLAAEILLPLLTTAWNKKEIPEDWNEGVIIKIPKKGTLSDCNNWRGITLLSIPSKVLAKIVINRISSAVDGKLREEQAGFRQGRGCIDQIFTLRNIIEQCIEWQRELYINFVDFEKAFDSIHRNSLWKILRYYGIPLEIVSIIQCFYNNFTCRVGNSQNNLQVLSGVRQGCVMSALLFNLAIDWIMRQTTGDKNRGIRWNLFTNLEDLDFADDLALLSHTHTHIQEKTNELNTNAKQVGLKISKKKTEMMVLNIPNPRPIRVDETLLPFTDQFKYLGSNVTTDGGANKDIIERLGKVRNAFRMLNPVWKSQQYKLNTKLKLYRSCVLSTLLYGSECWRMIENDLCRLSSFHTKSLRKIARIFWPRYISNEDLLEQCQQETMETIIIRRRWRWIGHVLRKEQDAIPRVAVQLRPEGHRKRGRPKTTWRRTVEAEAAAMGQSWGTLRMLAQDREQWKEFVAALIAHGKKGSK